jgi:thymidylate synthase
MLFENANHAFQAFYEYIEDRYDKPNFAGTKALFNISFGVENVLDRVITNPKRNFKQEYADYEWEWYLKGDRDASEIAERAKIWKNMMVDGTTEVNSNYGYFWNKNNQLDRVIDLLKKDPNTRRAVVVHYDLDELDRYQYDTPCNMVLNFYVKDNKLELSVFARSIDLWFGFCNDFYTFSKLMELVSEKTGYEIGDMNWLITNLHIYERHFNKGIKWNDK